MRRLIGTAILALTAVTIPAHAACNVALSPADIERAATIAIGAEYGDAQANVQKWSDPVRIGISGTPTPADRERVEEVVAELALLIAPAQISIVQDDSNIRLQFAPVDDFPKLLATYVPVNYGFFWMYFNRTGLYDADVLISTTGLTRAETDHLIREELTQVLGMANDVDDDPASIFYTEWTDGPDYTVSDTKVVRALYCADVTHGMSEDDFRETLAIQASRLGKAEVAALQRSLVALGHDIAVPDGTVGEDTKAAISAEQERLGLFVDGEPNLGLLAALKVKG